MRAHKRRDQEKWTKGEMSKECLGIMGLRG